MKRAITIIFFVCFFAAIFFLYYKRIETFSFGDEWNNWIAAYFMLKGRSLYSQIFYNHQMLTAYISLLIQKVFHPESLYRLVFYHRMFVILFSFVMDIFLILRFRFVGAAVVVLYELTKYYLFGSLFLSEAFIVQPTIYLFGLTMEKISHKKISYTDLVAGALFSWFIIFMREPFVPLAIGLYALLLWGKFKREQWFSLGIFIFLSFLTLLTVSKSFSDYLFQVVTFNKNILIPYETGRNNINPVESFLYPLYILFQGKFNDFRELLIALDIVFITSAVMVIRKLKNFRELGLIFVTLGISAIRFVSPGTLFYETFHMLPWYGIFLFSTFFLLLKLGNNKLNKIQIVLVILFLAISLKPSSFVWAHIDKQEQFTINYINYYQNGQAIRALSKPTDTLFADQWDYIIHYEAGLDSSYKQAIYSFVVSGYPPYQKERAEMFIKNPPDFYYTYCSKGMYHSELLPASVENLYFQLQRNGKPSCLYVKKAKLSTITPSQKEEIKKFGFSLPDNLVE